MVQGDGGLGVEPSGRNSGRDRAVKSVDHALDVLEFLAHEQSAVGVTSLAERLGLNASTVHHLLKTLQARGFVEQHPTSKLYRLGIRCLTLGHAYLADLDLYGIALPYMKQAARDCGETVTLAALDGGEVVPLASVPGSHTLRSQGAPASRHNAHATALGKVLLATLTPDELDDLVAGEGLARFTPRTIGTFRQLEAELAAIREQGHALDLEESELGLCCVGAPVHDHRRETLAAVAISIPSARFGDDRRSALVDLVKATARQISARLGSEPDRASPPFGPPPGGSPARR
jgi:IclR family acetate operon transcriptional repressor